MCVHLSVHLPVLAICIVCVCLVFVLQCLCYCLCAHIVSKFDHTNVPAWPKLFCRIILALYGGAVSFSFAGPTPSHFCRGLFFFFRYLWCRKEPSLQPPPPKASTGSCPCTNVVRSWPLYRTVVYLPTGLQKFRLLFDKSWLKNLQMQNFFLNRFPTGVTVGVLKLMF